MTDRDELAKAAITGKARGFTLFRKAVRAYKLADIMLAVRGMQPAVPSARLRLTDAEREAVVLACGTLRHMSTDDQAVAATLRGLLERIGGE